MSFIFNPFSGSFVPAIIFDEDTILVSENKETLTDELGNLLVKDF